MFSIVIPIYNKESYISRTLTSVLNQTFSDFEVIIVDDGSTDNSIQVVKRFNDERVKIVSQENKGVSSARNLGVEHAQNSYIAFIDADDIWEPKFLEAINKLILSYPSASAYYTNYKVGKKRVEINKTNHSIEWDTYLIKDYFQFALDYKAILTSCIVIKKDVFINLGGFCTEYKRGEDLYLWTQIALKYQVAYTSYTGAFYYRDVPNSLSRMKFNIKDSFSDIAEEFYEKNKELAINKHSFREYMIAIISSKGKYLLIMHRKKEARTLLQRYLDTTYNKKKVYILYLLSYLPKFIVKNII
ncbi:glycosyltransferase family 2 protein [Priestia filamentosa]|uniref:glycosyltransferase family 2 protein n=1 Tax=Priestia filamentosa TaxID=1402861 RepID=UPI00398210E6